MELSVLKMLCFAGGEGRRNESKERTRIVFEIEILTRQDKTKQDETRQDKTGQDRTGQDRT